MIPTANTITSSVKAWGTAAATSGRCTNVYAGDQVLLASEWEFFDGFAKHPVPGHCVYQAGRAA